MTSYFWSGFPSLSGRSDVMYGRRHIGGATHPLRHPYRLGLLRYRSAYRPGFLVWFCRQQRLVDLVQSPVAINEPILSTKSLHEKRVSLLLAFCPRRAGEIEISFRLDGDAQLCITTLHSVRMLAPQTGPAERARSVGYISIIRGNYYERPSSSILIFCSRPPRPPRHKTKLGSMLTMEMILWGYMRGRHHQSASSERWENSLQLWLQGRLGFASASLTDWIRPSIRPFVHPSIHSFVSYLCSYVARIHVWEDAAI